MPGNIDHTPPEVVFVKAGVEELTHTDVVPPAIAEIGTVLFTTTVTSKREVLAHPYWD